MVEVGLRRAGFDSPLDLLRMSSCDAELMESLRSLRLLVVDLSDDKLLPIYHLAHAISVPCLRLHVDDHTDHDYHLPKILQGHWFGYRNDIIRIGDEKIEQQIFERAQASVTDSHTIVDLSVGNAEIQRRGAAGHGPGSAREARPHPGP